LTVVGCRLSVKSVESGESGGLVYRVSYIVERLVFSWAGFSPSISTACFSARTIRFGGISEIGGGGVTNVMNVMNVTNVMNVMNVTNVIG